MTQLACFTSFQPKPLTIESLCQSSGKGVVVQGLSDGSIQLLNSDTLAHLGAIPGDQLRSVRRILFFGDSIITSGVHGSVTMWCLRTLTEVCSVESSQGAIWDMVLRGNKLYLATETGAVVVIELTSTSMTLGSIWRTSAKKGSSVRSLSVCLENDSLFVGDATGTISRWNLKSGICDSTFAIPAKNNKAVLIWALTPLGNDRIVSGDSCGTLSVWDALSCTLVESRQDHQADILVIHRIDSALYSSGVDSRVVKYVIGQQSLSHEATVTVVARDISAMTGTATRLLVGGAEGRMGVILGSSLLKLDRFAHQKIVVANRFILCQSAPECVQLYRVSDEEKKHNEYIAELVETEPLSAFTVTNEGVVGITTISGKCTILNVLEKVEEIKFQTLPISVSLLTETQFIGVSNEGVIVLTDLNTMKQTSININISDIPKSVYLNRDLTVVCYNGKVHTVSLSKKKIIKSIDLASTITAVLQHETAMYLATADHQIHKVCDEAVWSKKIPKTCKLNAFQHIHEIVAVDTETLILIGESFAITLTDLEGRTGLFRPHSSAPMGGVIVGAGVNAQTPLIVLAGFKQIQAQLTRPFDRKSFQA